MKKLNFCQRKNLFKMASNRNTTPTKTKCTPDKNSLETYSDNAITNMSRGRFTCASAKKTGNTSSVSAIPKEISGMKATLKKEAVFSENYAAEQKRVDEIIVSENRTKSEAASLIDPSRFIVENFDSFPNVEEDLDYEQYSFIVSQFVYIPALCLCGTLGAMSLYLQANIFHYNSDKDLKRFASRVFIKYVASLMHSKSSRVVTAGSLAWDEDKGDVTLRGEVDFNRTYYAKSNISSDAGTLSNVGMQASRDLNRKLTAFINACANNMHDADEWWQVSIDETEIKKALNGLFEGSFPISFSAIPSKTNGDFAALPATKKKIPHSKFLEMCAAVGAYTNISFSKVSSDQIVSKARADGAEGGKTQIKYRFCDMNNHDEVRKFADMLPLKIDGTASVSEGKTGCGKRGSSQKQENPVAYVLSKYFNMANVRSDGASFADEEGVGTEFASLMNGGRETDVTADFLKDTNTGLSGFRGGKVSCKTSSHAIIFNNTVPFDADTILRLKEKQLADEYDGEFWSLFLNMVKRTVKISGSRGSKDNSSSAQTSEQRARRFFEILLADVDISVDDVMSDFISKTTKNSTVGLEY